MLLRTCLVHWCFSWVFTRRASGRYPFERGSLCEPPPLDAPDPLSCGENLIFWEGGRGRVRVTEGRLIFGIWVVLELFGAVWWAAPPLPPTTTPLRGRNRVFVRGTLFQVGETNGVNSLKPRKGGGGCLP